jgi:4-amino-4-deoxy-L-arabinose transferase-like glycosyltransferase
MNRASRTRWLLLALVALGFVLRLGLAIKVGINEAPAPGSDEQEYDTYAWNVAQGRGYRGMSADVTDRDHLTAFRPPGTSLAWAGLYRVFGHRYDVVRITHCLAGAASILLVYLIGRRCFDDTVGVLSASAYTVWPLALYYSAQLLSESLGTLWFLWFVLECIRFADRPTWGGAAWAGVLLGLAILTRPNPIFMIPLTGLWALWQFRRSRSTLLKGLAIPLLAVATMVPWWIRNYAVFQTFIPISTLGGSGLLQGNNRIVVTDHRYYGYSVWDTKIPEYRDALRSANDEVERDRRAKQFAIQWLKDHPDQWPFLAGAKLIRAWTPFLRSHTPSLYRVGTLLSWGPVLILFLVAFVPTWVGFLRSGNPGWLIHLTVVNNLIITLLFWGETRYRYSIEPLCIILAAQVVAFGLARLRGREDSRSPLIPSHATIGDSPG